MTEPLCEHSNPIFKCPSLMIQSAFLKAAFETAPSRINEITMKYIQDTIRNVDLSSINRYAQAKLWYIEYLKHKAIERKQSFTPIPTHHIASYFLGYLCYLGNTVSERQSQELIKGLLERRWNTIKATDVKVALEWMSSNDILQWERSLRSFGIESISENEVKDADSSASSTSTTSSSTTSMGTNGESSSSSSVALCQHGNRRSECLLEMKKMIKESKIPADAMSNSRLSDSDSLLMSIGLQMVSVSFIPYESMTKLESMNKMYLIYQELKSNGRVSAARVSTVYSVEIFMMVKILLESNNTETQAKLIRSLFDRQWNSISSTDIQESLDWLEWNNIRNDLVTTYSPSPSTSTTTSRSSQSSINSGPTIAKEQPTIPSNAPPIPPSPISSPPAPQILAPNQTIYHPGITLRNEGSHLTIMVGARTMVPSSGTQNNSLNTIPPSSNATTNPYGALVSPILNNPLTSDASQTANEGSTFPPPAALTDQLHQHSSNDDDSNPSMNEF